MRRSRILSMAAILAVAACRDGTGTTGPHVAPHIAPDGPSRWVEGRYPTEEEYYAEVGDARPTVVADFIKASFTSDRSAWIADAEISYQWGNYESGKLTAEVRYKDGAIINNDADEHLVSQWWPRVVKHTEKFRVYLGTNGHTCDILGKAQIQSVTGVKFSTWSGTLSMYERRIDTQFPDETLPPCNASECDDPTTPAIEECGTGEREEPADGYNDPNGGGGDCPTCVEQPPDGPTRCWVRIWYNKRTEEVVNAYILYCY